MEQYNLWGGTASEKHPPQPGSVRNEAKNKKSSKEIQMNGMFHPIFKKTQPVMMRRWKNDFWAITGEFIYRHHVLPRVKLCVPKEESFPIPFEVYRRYKNNTYVPGCIVGKHIEDYWMVDGERKLSDAWTGFTRFILFKESPPEGYTCCGWRLTRKQSTSRPDDIWPDMWKFYFWCSEKESKTKMGYRETKDRQCQTIERNILHRTKTMKSSSP